MVKDQGSLQGNFEIFESRIMNLKNVFSVWYWWFNILFDGNFTNDLEKYLLLHKLQKCVSKDEYNFEDK